MEIIIYTLSWCPHCKALKEYLNNKSVEYKNIDVEENEDAAEEIIKKTGQSSFPVVQIEEDIIVGFDKDLIEKLLHKEND